MNGDIVRAECRECEWTGDYGDGTVFPTPLTQMMFHVIFAGHVVELIPAPDPGEEPMCCEPDYDYERGQYVHDKGCHGSVLANDEAIARVIRELL